MATGFNGSGTPVELRDYWRTPQFAFIPLDHEFNFALDVAADDSNNLVSDYLTKQDDALRVDWYNLVCTEKDRTVWCNPPYSSIEPWMLKAEYEARKGVTTVMLVPHTPDAGWWPTMASEIRVITGVNNPSGRNTSGRIQFLRADTGKPAGNQNKGSCYVIFAPHTLGHMVTRYVPITHLQTETNRLIDEGLYYAEKGQAYI